MELNGPPLLLRKGELAGGPESWLETRVVVSGARILVLIDAAHHLHLLLAPERPAGVALVRGGLVHGILARHVVRIELHAEAIAVGHL